MLSQLHYPNARNRSQDLWASRCIFECFNDICTDYNNQVCFITGLQKVGWYYEGTYVRNGIYFL